MSSVRFTLSAEIPSLPVANSQQAWGDALADAVPDWDAPAQPEPECLLDQQVPW
jgi:hypothetical protein